MKKIYWICAAVAAVTAAVFAGCVLTGTVVMTAKVAPDAAGEPINITNLDYSEGELEVDLSNNATFKDYRDDIRNIENIGFYLEARNNRYAPVTFQIFLEPDTAANYANTEDMVQSRAQPVLTELIIPAQESVVIDWNESMQYISGLDEFKGALETGVFSLYPAAVPRDAFNVTIDSLVMIVTLTGKK